MDCFVSDLYQGPLGIYSYYFFKQEPNRYTLLPNCHAAYYPLSVQPESGKVLDGEVNFFNEHFARRASRPSILSDQDIDLAHFGKPKKNQAIVLNLLDNCYGHSIIKLLNTSVVFERHGKKYDLICISPMPLTYLLPPEHFRIIQINVGYDRLANCYDLAALQQKIAAEYETVEYYLFPMYREFDRSRLASFFNFYPTAFVPKPHKDKISFIYRTNFYRTWNGAQQRQSVVTLFEHLQPYFASNVEFCVIGEKDECQFPSWIKDYRVAAFTKETDANFNALYQQSIFCIGMFGSGLYMPTILCDTVYHLVPLHKQPIAMEDCLNYTQSSILSAYEHPQIFGDILNLDLTPQDLARQVIVFYASQLEKRYKMSMVMGNPLERPRGGQTATIKATYPGFHYEKARQFRIDQVGIAEKRILRRWRWHKLARLLRLQSSP